MTRGITTALAVLVLTLAACGDPPAEVRPGLTMTTAVETTAATTTTTQAASTTVSPKTTAAGGGTAACETVGFTPNTEDAASSITATGVSCAEARAFVEVAGRQTSSGGPPDVDVQGYRCVRTRSLQDPLPQAFYECTKDGTTITFVRS